jgi:hypothetical protein
MAPCIYRRTLDKNFVLYQGSFITSKFAWLNILKKCVQLNRPSTEPKYF